MGQVVGKVSDIFRCNLRAIQTGGSKANTILAADEVWLVDTTNSLTNSLSGNCDAYIKGDGSTAATALELHKFKAEELEEKINGYVNEETVELTYSRNDASTWTLNSSNNFAYSSSNLCIWLPIISGNKYIVSASSSNPGNMAYGVLKTRPDITTTTSKAADYATGCARVTVAAGNSDEFTAPSDANWIVLVLKSSAGALYSSLYEKQSTAVRGIKEEAEDATVGIITDKDFAIVDEDGNAIAVFENGHIKTRNFDSENIETKNTFFGIENAYAAKKNMTNSMSSLNNYSQFATIVHITDNHGDADRTRRAFEVAKLLDASIACTGDIVRYNSGDDYSWMLNIIADFQDIQYDQCLGNHDVRSFLDSSAYTKYIAPLYAGQRWTLPSESNPTYYYRDDATYKIRFISLNQWQDDETTSHTTPIYKQGQADFLVSALTTLPADYGVVILMHSPETKPEKDNDYPKFFSRKVLYTQTFTHKIATEVVDAFISKTALSKTFGTVTVNADFTNVASNEFIAFLSGHYHCDMVSFVPGTTNSMVMLNETCTNAWINMNTDGTAGTDYPKFNEPSDLARQIGTENEDAFNVYCIDRTNRIIKITRIGSQLPYDLSEKRDYMTIEY